jgi:hypothetical protein
MPRPLRTIDPLYFWSALIGIGIAGVLIFLAQLMQNSH